jgi:hypothetical protein
MIIIIIIITPIILNIIPRIISIVRFFDAVDVLVKVDILTDEKEFDLRFKKPGSQ